MSNPEEQKRGREELLRRLAMAGRDMSDAAVVFHSVLAEKLGLSAGEWKTLGLLERYGPQTAGDLSERSGLAPASITGILDRLERRGWIRRGRDPEDRRRVVVTMQHRAATRDFSKYFGGLLARLDELYERYGNDQMEMLIGFLSEVAQRQKDATMELTRAKPRRTRPPREE
ncbi:MAG: MarR family winged helix-turn-helix transcriptional regulator [Bryobacteraceae bacterium]